MTDIEQAQRQRDKAWNAWMLANAAQFESRKRHYQHCNAIYCQLKSMA